MKRTLPLSLAFVFVGFVIALPTAHAAGLTLSGDQTQTISIDQTIVGDIILSDNAKLTIQNATVTVEHAPTQPRTNIQLHDHAQLILENAALIPPAENPDNLYLDAFGHSQITLNNSAFINVLNLVEDAKVVGNGARIYSSASPINIGEDAGAFGIVQLAGNAVADFTNSTIGSFALFFDKNDEAELSNLKPQRYADFNLQRDAIKFSPHYNIILRNSSVLPVKLHGPFERSWAIFVDPESTVTIKDSSLNKLCFQQFNNRTLSFKNLDLDMPETFSFHNIHIVNTSISNEWGFFGKDSSISIEDSNGVWLWPMGTGNWEFKNSHMIEFDPRGFTGTLHFNNSEWANAGEVFDGTHLTMTGNYSTAQQLNEHLVLADSSVDREFPVTVLDGAGASTTAFTTTVLRGGALVAQADNGDHAALRVHFDASNYKEPLRLNVVFSGKTKTIPFDLFSATPLAVSFNDSPAPTIMSSSVNATKTTPPVINVQRVVRPTVTKKKKGTVKRVQPRKAKKGNIKQPTRKK